MRKVIIALIILYSSNAQLCAQSDSLTQILDDIQDDDVSLNNWLEILSDQLVDNNENSRKTYPKISLTHRFQYTIEETQAFADNIFIGSPFESYTRLHVKIYPNLSTGILIQKDVGERNFYDHVSGFIAWNHPEYPIKIFGGNFYIRGAEGLLLSGPFSLPKNALILNSDSNQYHRAKPFLSSNEYDGFFGGLIQYGEIKGLKVTGFYSEILRDGTLSDDNIFITGFDRSGYHRSLSEKTKVNRISEKTYGGVISLPVFLIEQLGLIYVRTRYFPELNINSSPEEKRRIFYKFYGSFIENYSLFCTKNFRNLHLSGEISPVKPNKISYIATINFYHSDWHFVLKSWQIPSQFQSPFGRIPSNSNPFPQSVQGFMIGAIGKPLPDLKITTFWFHKKDLWRTYFQPLPLQKKELYIQSEYRLGKQKNILFRYHISSSNFYSPDIQGKFNKVKQSFRIQHKQSFSTKIRFQSRFEKVVLNFYPHRPSQKGINFYQDLYCQIIKSVTLQIRFSSFNTNDYDSRIYEYENDLPNVFSNYALYGRGKKWYLMLSVIPVPKIKIWVKYRRITFDGVDSIGSGIMTINNDMRQDIHLQLEFRY
jgi:hypothetical protein